MLCAFLPMRSGSQRVKKKNTRKFAGVDGGLCYVKISQLVQVEEIDKVVVSSDDVEVLSIARSFGNAKIEIDRRPSKLCQSYTLTDELIDYCSSVCDSSHILWTHSTSPFFGPSEYKDMIATYHDKIENGFDSLVTVNSFKEFLFDDKFQPINFDRGVEKWPRTQTLKELFRVNSAGFMSSRENYLKYNDRIGAKPYMYEVDEQSGFDIDWEPQFHLAEKIYRERQD